MRDKSNCHWPGQAKDGNDFGGRPVYRYYGEAADHGCG